MYFVASVFANPQKYLCHYLFSSKTKILSLSELHVHVVFFFFAPSLDKQQGMLIMIIMRMFLWSKYIYAKFSRHLRTPNWIYCLIKGRPSSINLEPSEEKFSITTTNCIINKATIHPCKTKERKGFGNHQNFVSKDFRAEAKNLES